jgi:hypothetical protein
MSVNASDDDARTQGSTRCEGFGFGGSYEK